MNILIHAESEADWPVIRAVTTLAFSGKPYAGGNEADIIDALRREGALTFSFVAVVADTIVGHVAFSPATSSHVGGRWFALGPVAVHPSVQRRGVGTKLIERGLKALTEIGAPDAFWWGVLITTSALDLSMCQRLPQTESQSGLSWSSC